jgi:E3 SUMO-protein ligase NSE2
LCCRHHSFTDFDRYAEHNDYVEWKNSIHGAYNPSEDAPPLPHARTWFPDDANALNPTQGGAAGESDDEDFEVTGVKRDLKCPLTLQYFKDPVTSDQCPHSFEKMAISELIGRSNLRTGGGSRRNMGERMERCPVSGCEKMLALSNLKEDPGLLNTVKRTLKALNRQRERDGDGDGDGTGRDGGAMELDGEEEDEDDYADVDDAPAEMVARVKSERRSQAMH